MWSIAISSMPSGSGRRDVAAREAGEERPLVAVALDEQVQGVAVGLDGGELHPAVLVLDPLRRVDAARAVRHGVLVGLGGVGHAQGDLVDTVAVPRVVGGDLVVALERAGQDDPDATLLEYVGDAVAATGLEPRVGGLREAVRAREEMRCLGGVSDVELDVVDAVNRHGVAGGRMRDRGGCGGHP